MSIRFTKVPEEANAVTHAGNFHADDIFSLILLEKVFGDLVVFRSNSSMPEAQRFSKNAIIFDIGFGEFDHHQKNGNGCHPSTDNTHLPIPYASFGLLWKKFGHILCDNIANGDTEMSSKIWQYMEYNLVMNIDAIDNGIYPQSPSNYDMHRVMTVSNVISMLNIYFKQDETAEQSLQNALTFAHFFFDHILNRAVLEITGKLRSFRDNPKFFTAEQVFSYVLLKKIFPMKSDEILMNFEIWNNDNMKYHASTQSFTGIEKQPIPASIMGKIWEAEGIKYCSSILNAKFSEYASSFIRSYLIIGIDAHANGIYSHGNEKYCDYGIITISDFIEFLNPIEYSENVYNNCWNEAVKFARLIFNRVESKLINRIQSKKYVDKKIDESLKQIPPHRRKLTDCSPHILVFDRHVHWQDWVSNSPDAKNIWFVVSPSNKGGYVVQPVPCKYNQNGYRKGFPSKWYGLNGEALRKVTKVPTATFIHPKNGFIAGAEDLAGAINLAKQAFANTECKRKV